jgi:hypothetical protein
MPTRPDRFQTEFREALQDIAGRVKPPLSVPPRAVRRARAKLGRNVAAAGLALALVAVVGLRALQLLQAAPAPEPVTSPSSSAAATTPSNTALVPLRTPTATRPLRALVVGDQFAADLGVSLAAITDSTYFRVIPWGTPSTGLSRPDYYDWPSRLLGFMEQYRPDIVVIMLGGNDPTTISRPSGGRIPFEDSRWRKSYRHRVEQMMDVASESTHVAWIGMPIMGDPTYRRNIDLIDSIDRTEAALYPNVTFIDTWSMFADQQGHYADSLPDKHGNLQVVRSPDRIHLSAAGNRILADALVQVMRENPRWRLAQKALG